jgi:hypothetical protein
MTIHVIPAILARPVHPKCGHSANGPCCALTAAGLGDHHRAARARLWRAAVAKNIVAGCTLGALILMVWLAYNQKHHVCWNGHLIERGHFIKGLRCGSASHSI